MAEPDKKPAKDAAPAKKTCFVIGPIGAEGSESRRKADFLLKGIILPAAAECGVGLDVRRADQIADPGLITEQIIEAVLDSDLVIADLSDQNPNAFYELAVRHSTDKPTIHMFPVGQTIPFDIQPYRAVSFDITDIDKLEAARAALAESMKVALAPGFKASNPISSALLAKKLRASADPRDALVTNLSEELRAVSERLRYLETTTESGRAHQRLFGSLSVPPPGMSYGGRSTPMSLRDITAGPSTQSLQRSLIEEPLMRALLGKSGVEKKEIE
jgi:hypothetical protein